MRKIIQAGFTLIELIVVIVIIGILAAVAIPQFANVETNARIAVGQGACGALQSSAVILYASNRQATSMANIISGVTLTGFPAGSLFTNNGCSGTTFATGGVTTTCGDVSTALCNGP